MEPVRGFARLLSEVVARQPAPDAAGTKHIGNRLEGCLQEIGGYKNVRTEFIYVPVGWNGSSEHCKEPAAAGRLMLENTMVRPHVAARVDAADVRIIQTFLGAWKPMFLSRGVPEAEVDLWVSEARTELEDPDALKAYTKWIVVCAQKVE
jgi:hypothetical protein